MSYNILNKNVNFQGSTKGTLEDIVDSHSDQSITGSKDFLRLTGSTVYIKNSLGIGTNSPISALEIEGGLTTTGAVLTLGTKEPTVVANDVLGRINFYAPLDTGTDSDEIGASIAAVAQATFSDSVNSTALVFQTGKSEIATTKMVIDEDGYVGIGTASPSARLHVKSSGNSTYPLYIEASDGSNLGGMYQGGSGNGSFYVRDADGTAKAVLMAVGASSFLGGGVNVAGVISGSGNISGSAFYGAGTGITGIPGSAVTLASGGGITDSSGLKLDVGVSAVGSLNSSDKILIFDADAADAVKRTTAGAIANLFDAVVSTFNGQTAHRVITCGGAETLDGEANLTFDGTDLKCTGNLSGSGNLQIGGTIRLDGMAITAPVSSVDHILFEDSDNLVKKSTFSSLASTMAGAAIVNSSGKFVVQVSGAVIIGTEPNDKIGLTGSIAGTGLSYGGGVDSISSIDLDLNGLPAASISVANDSIIIIDADGSNLPKKESFADVVTTMKGNGLTATSGILAVGAGTGIDVSTNAIAVVVSDFMTNGVDNRIITAAGTDSMNAEANLTFDGTDLTLAGNLSGSGYVSASAFVATEGNIIATGEGMVIANGIIVDNSIGLAGQGLWNNSGKLDIQTSGSIHTALLSGPRYHLGITGSIAGNGLLYEGGVNSISSLSVDVSDFMTNGSDNRIVTVTGTDGMNAEANLTFDGSVLTVTGSVLTLDSSNDAKIFDSTVGTSGSVVALKYKEVAHTCGTENDNDEVANFFTSGMIPFALGIRVTSAIGNNAYVTKIGTMNDDDSFGTFGDGDVEESGDNLVTSYHPANATGQNTKWFTSNHELKITYNATPSSGALRLGLYYYDITPPTS